MPRTRHRRRQQGLQIARLLAVLVCIAAIVDFGFNAFLWREHDYSYRDPITGRRTTADASRSSLYDVSHGDFSDAHLAFDAGITMLASIAALIASLSLSKVSRRTKRLVLGVAVVVVTPGLVCSFLFA